MSDAFISHSAADKLIADSVCATLEQEGVRCWMAPRDIAPGEEWADAIIRGIDTCQVMVLVFSKNANESPFVIREMERAVSTGKSIIPFRIENVIPTGSMALFASAVHWLDAFTPPMELHLRKLASQVMANLAGESGFAPVPVRRPIRGRPRKPGIAWLAGAAVVIAGTALFVMQKLDHTTVTPAAGSVPVAQTSKPPAPLANPEPAPAVTITRSVPPPPPVPAPAPVKPSASDQRAQVEKKLVELKTGFLKEIEMEAGARYNTAVVELERLYLLALERGDVAAAAKASPLWKARIEVEKQSVLQHKGVPATDAPDDPSGLRLVRGTFRSELAKNAAMRDGLAAPAHDRYAAALAAYAADAGASIPEECKALIKAEQDRASSQRPKNVIAAPAAARPVPVQPAKPSALPIIPFSAQEAKAAQQKWASTLKGQVVETNSAGMKMVLIPPGQFDMGSDNGSPLEAPRHSVTLTRPFRISMHEVTQAQFEKVTGRNPLKPDERTSFRGPDVPVVWLYWDEAVEFCAKLGDVEKKKYRLPTETEWEFACRAGSDASWHFGNEVSKLGDYAWTPDNAGGTPHPTGQKLPNAFGLFDMHGNVLEMCADFDGPYPSGDVTDPAGPKTGRYHLFRGGSWFFDGMKSKSSARQDGQYPDRGTHVGFRVVREAGP